MEPWRCGGLRLIVSEQWQSENGRQVRVGRSDCSGVRPCPPLAHTRKGPESDCRKRSPEVVYIGPQTRTIMAFPVPITSALSGATPRQLAYWRRPTRAARPLLVPGAKRSGRYLYSWADVVALRAIVYLRQEKSLPKIRGAVNTLRALEAEDWEHLSQYQLLSTGNSIIVKTPRGEPRGGAGGTRRRTGADLVDRRASGRGC